MIQALRNNWWLLLLCGIFEAMYSITSLLMRTPEGAVILRRFANEDSAVFWCELALAAGIAMIAAGILGSPRGRSWLLVLSGLALSAYGLIPILVRNRSIRFLPFAILLAAMAIGVGAVAVRSGGLLAGLGAALILFAFPILALGFRWFRLVQPGSFFVWMSIYFALNAICMLGLGLQLKRPMGGITNATVF